MDTIEVRINGKFEEITKNKELIVPHRFGVTELVLIKSFCDLRHADYCVEKLGYNAILEKTKNEGINKLTIFENREDYESYHSHLKQQILSH